MATIAEMELMEETLEIPLTNLQVVPLDKEMEVEMAKIQTRLELEAESLGDGDGGSLLSKASKDFKISIETEDATDSNHVPVLPLSNISDDVACSVAATAKATLGDDTHSVEFSEEKDVPEMSTRVYDFDMVKEKTLPRRVHLMRGGLFQFCASQPKSHLLAWSLLGTSILICVFIFVAYLFFF